MNRNERILALFVVVALIFGLVAVQAAVDQKKVDELLETIKTYDFGDSRAPLTDLSDIIREAYTSPDDLRQLEKKFIKFLKSDATFAGKQFICQRLSLFGTEASVPVLAKMLASAKEADIARFALERIPGPKVDEALRKMVPKTSGLVQIGIINTIGVRKDEKAIPLLQGLVFDEDAGVSEAALAALGNIGTPAAAQVLEKVVQKPAAANRLTALDAYLKCADNLLAAGETTQAMSMYRKLDGPDVPVPIRVAALRGMIKADPGNASLLVLNVIRGGDPAAKSLAIKMIRELPDRSKLRDFAAELHNLSPYHKVQLITAFGDIGDPSVREYVVRAAHCKVLPVRLAALRALASLGDASTVDLLAQRAATSQGDEKEAALHSLYRLRGRDVDSRILKSLETAEPKVKLVLIEALGERVAVEAVDTLFDYTKADAPKVRLAAIEVLGQLARTADLDRLIDVLVNAQNESERTQAISSVAATAKRIKDGKKSALILERVGQVKDAEPKAALLRVLGLIGEDDALPVLRKALKDKNEKIQIAAIRALSDWPNDGPIEDVLNLAKTSKNKRFKVLALRGYIRLIKVNPKRGDGETIKMYQQAMNLADEVNEKRMVLSGLGSLGSLEALNATLPYLDQKEIQAEAEVAVVQICRRIRGSHPKEAREALQKVIGMTRNENTKKDAERELKRIKI